MAEEDRKGIARECRKSIMSALRDVDDIKILRRIYLIVLAARYNHCDIATGRENNMNKEEIQEAVRDYINQNESASYAELQWLFEEKGYDYKGELLSCSDVCEHVVFWAGWNAEAFDLMTELLHEGVAHREPAHPLRYLLDGAALTLPKVRRAVQYKTDHWAPVVFVKGPGAA